MLIATKDFMEAFPKSPYFERIFRNHDIIVLYLSGSRCINCIDERSDFDIVAITNDKDTFYEPNEFYTYKGLKVHVYYHNYIGIFDGDFSAALYNIKFSNEIKFCLYKNSKYENVINIFESNADIMTKIFIYKMYNLKSSKEYINNVLEENDIAEKNYTKLLYHHCYASYVIRSLIMRKLSQQCFADNTYKHS